MNSLCYMLPSIAALFCTACAPVLKSTLTEAPDVTVPADRIELKGFVYKQTYLVGKDRTYGPSGGVGYTITKIGKTIAHAISVALGFRYEITDREQYGDIGTLRTLVKNELEERNFARAVVTKEDKQEIALAPLATALILDGKSGNEAVQGATPWYWWAWNVVDYVSLLAFVGVPVHYEKEATVSLGVYNRNYERLGHYKGYARVSQKCYVVPGERLVQTTLEYAYKDALNKAAADWARLRAGQPVQATASTP
ncbi:MAG: hypothetical protein N2595_07095 [bacterium]|nr:hypothetical protein [bacterium]